MHYNVGWQGGWSGGSKNAIVASDAKNGTPISAMAYQIVTAESSLIRWHVFYVGVDGFVRQKSNSNETNVWTDGNINAQNLTVKDTEQVTLQACWDGSFYSDDDASHFFPLINSTNNDTGTGLQLYFAGDSSGVKQYVTTEGQDGWTQVDTWETFSGHGGIACTCTVARSPTAYTMGVDLHDSVELWWKDSNTSDEFTQLHPINVWANGEYTCLWNTL
jgi:hypothetical protein